MVKPIQLTKRADHVALITFDSPQKSVNTLTNESIDCLEEILDELAGDSSIRACVLNSAKKDSFIAGADLDALHAVTTAKEAERLSRRSHALLNRVAQLRIPVVAAVHGSALGAGLEIMLACDYRVVTNDSRTVFALPEVQLGLLPGGGGTQRLFRLIGLREALPMLLAGKRVRAKKALELGLVDRVVERETLIETAARFALKQAKHKTRLLRGRLSIVDRALMFPLVRTLLLRQARKSVLRKTSGLYPAPMAILKCVETGLRRGMHAGLEKESELFGRLVVSPEAKHLIWLFHATHELKRAAGKPSVKTLGVLGAGLMGEGIATVSLPLNKVVLKDVSAESMSRAKSHISAYLGKRSGTSMLERLSCTTEMRELAGSELIIEAVFENLELKRRVLAEVEAVVSPTAVFASNTSALPIGQIAARARHPERVLGMHYFSPVPRMPLLEIVVTAQTSATALSTAQSYGAAQGKTVIVVKDSPGFYTTRILAPLLNESMLLLEEGASIEAVDKAMKRFGFPVGPIALLDEVGIDVGAHVAKDLGKAFEARSGEASEALSRMHQAGYAGKKNHRGFYVYPKGKKKAGKKLVNEKVYEFFGGSTRKHFEPTLIADRIALMMINEAIYCLQEEVIRSPLDGDVGAVLGLGFPPFQGGPFHYVDTMGAARIATRLSDLTLAFGPRFKPAPLLLKMAQSESRFFQTKNH
ncbi:MAG: enoyl-CoA hydratase/isomerase family protein [Deltaproteobacteria bacterium]|nr:enoyl-CoA hydratase/isomerase family protein [Deltaproteobacteria bacterium]